MKAHENVEVMKVNVDRRAFTKHGQHMNATGKEEMAKKIAESIKHTLGACKTTPIIMKWIEDTSQDNQGPGKTKHGDRDERDHTEHQNDNVPAQENNSRQQEKEAVMITSRRSQTTPASRNEDTLRTGKEVTTKKIAESIEHTSEEWEKTPIIMKLKEATSHDNQGPGKTKNGVRDERDPTEHRNDNIQAQENNSRQHEKEAVLIASRRSRKTPVTRNKDFLWPTTSKIQAR
jgi:hypothetical protein